MKQNPQTASLSIALLAKGRQLDVLGSYHGFLLVRFNDDLLGWIKKK